MVNIKQIVKKIIPKKEDATIRLIVQQDVAENIRQLCKLTDKDIERAGSVLNRIFKAVDKRIMK
jgi:K+/H+ antiporter YhaU regulatory subunit KhtT